MRSAGNMRKTDRRTSTSTGDASGRLRRPVLHKVPKTRTIVTTKFTSWQFLSALDRRKRLRELGLEGGVLLSTPVSVAELAVVINSLDGERDAIGTDNIIFGTPRT